MMMKKRRWLSAVVSGAMTLSMWSGAGAPMLTASALTGNNSAYNKSGSNVVEYLDRGINAGNTGAGMLVSWRFLATDPDDAVFRLYRDDTLVYTSTDKDNEYSKGATCFLDAGGSAKSKYRVETYSGDRRIANDTGLLQSNNAYYDIKLDRPGSIYTPNDMSVGDVDGDGQYELFVKWDPNNSQDNSKSGKTDKVYIDCYRLDGTKLWRIDLGYNIRAGAHYTQFFVADYDLDGKCEMTCKTADGTVDGVGRTIGDGSKTYRNSKGYVLDGPEYYTLFDGETGAALDTVNYEPARGTVSSWGDSYGNRVDRFWGTVAYLDGVHPCVVTGRGYYTRLTATAYTVQDKKLKKLWTYDSGNSNSSTNAYGDGNHNSMAADVDGDGKQEIITGPAIIDDNGTMFYSTKQGHGDAMHVGDLDPTNPGIEVYICHEEKASGYGVTLYDADAKKILFHHNNSNGDTGRCCGDNVWANNPGAELWGNQENGGTPVLDVKGNTLDCRRPAINFLSYWDGDLEREILDGYTDSPATISKLTGEPGKTTITNLLVTDGFYTCNTTKGTPCLSADLFGDWREELIVRSASGDAIRIYCTTYDTDYRIQCLMHDPQYRTQVSAQQTAYNQPPHTSFFLGSGYAIPARPACTVNTRTPKGKAGAVIDTANTYRLKNVNSGLYLTLDPDADNDVVQKKSGLTGWTFEDAGDGYYRLYNEQGDGRTYLLDLDFGKTDNGTNIHVWTDTENDAQLFKLVDNGDGTYTLCTKNTNDQSCVGITGGAKDEGTSAIEWTCNDSNDQKWVLEIKIDPIQGKYFSDLQILDTKTFKTWKTDSDMAVGDLVAGDREFTYTSLPDALVGAESIQVACDAKFTESDLATFTAASDATVYIALDSRVENVPAFMSGYTKTDLTASTSNDVTYVLYAKDVSQGETVTLGSQGQSAYCINYTVFLAPKAAAEPASTAPAETTTQTAVTTAAASSEETTETTTTTALQTTASSAAGSTAASETTTTAETTATVPESTAPEGSKPVYGDINCDGTVDILDVIKLNKYLLGSADDISEQGKQNADVDINGSIDTTDSLNIVKFIVDLTTLPVQ